MFFRNVKVSEFYRLLIKFKNASRNDWFIVMQIIVWD